MDFMAMATQCAPLVAPGTARALMAVESGGNPYAIGVVAGSLERQPRTLAEAVATVRALDAAGRNFSVGLAQINKTNFARLGLTLQTAFDPCANLAAMQTILGECFARATARTAHEQRALQQAISCYYSGNFQTGFDHGYVQKVVAAWPAQQSK
jgi:type IV secretion system protein VirB1